MTVTPLELARPASVTDAFLRQLVARVPGSSGATWKLTEVYTGDVLVELPQSTPEDIERAMFALMGKWVLLLWVGVAVIFLIILLLRPEPPNKPELESCRIICLISTYCLMS